MHIVRALLVTALSAPGVFAKTCTLRPLGIGKSDVSQVRCLNFSCVRRGRLKTLDNSLYASDDRLYAANASLCPTRSRQPLLNAAMTARLSLNPANTTLLGRKEPNPLKQAI